MTNAIVKIRWTWSRFESWDDKLDYQKDQFQTLISSQNNANTKTATEPTPAAIPKIEINQKLIKSVADALFDLLPNAHKSKLLCEKIVMLFLELNEEFLSSPANMTPHGDYNLSKQQQKNLNTLFLVAKHFYPGIESSDSVVSFLLIGAFLFRIFVATTRKSILTNWSPRKILTWISCRSNFRKYWVQKCAC